MSAPEFDLYVISPGRVVVCSSLPEAETTARVNAHFPAHAGYDPAGLVCGRKFEDGEESPRPCINHPTTHLHYLYVPAPGGEEHGQQE